MLRNHLVFSGKNINSFWFFIYFYLFCVLLCHLSSEFYGFALDLAKYTVKKVEKEFDVIKLLGNSHVLLENNQKDIVLGWFTTFIAFEKG